MHIWWTIAGIFSAESWSVESVGRVAEEGFLPWGTFDLCSAAPEVVLASLTQTPASFSAASDMWSLGIVLYEASSGISYWQGYNQLEITNALLGLTLLPHMADDNVLSRCLVVRPTAYAVLLSNARAFV
jgi:serine/threonine protein kinase